MGNVEEFLIKNGCHSEVALMATMARNLTEARELLTGWANHYLAYITEEDGELWFLRYRKGALMLWALENGRAV